MAEKTNFPQIPSTVWWGLRQALRKSPNASIDDAFLGVNLGVQAAAARQYVAELRRVGLLGEEGRATPLAMKWRNDETYREAANEIVKLAYPQALLDIAPPQDAERSKVISWFMLQGLGEGTARNKAATYLLIANEPIADSPDARANLGIRQTTQPDKKKLKKPARTNATEGESSAMPSTTQRVVKPEQMPLNVNVQIHISADASSEQIETIFSSMRRYLYNDGAA